VAWLVLPWWSTVSTAMSKHAATVTVLWERLSTAPTTDHMLSDHFDP
jgi:hypothetical protein